MPCFPMGFWVFLWGERFLGYSSRAKISDDTLCFFKPCLGGRFVRYLFVASISSSHFEISVTGEIPGTVGLSFKDIISFT